MPEAFIKHWDEDPQDWDRLRLDDEPMPGVWRVTYDIKRAMDVKKAKGTDHVTLKDEGYEATEFTLTGRFISAGDWAQWQDVFPRIQPRRPRDARTPMRADHPAIRLAKIKTIYIFSVSSPELGDDGIMTVTLRAYEVEKPTPTPKTGKAAASAPATYYEQLPPPDALNRFPGMRGPLE